MMVCVHESFDRVTMLIIISPSYHHVASPSIDTTMPQTREPSDDVRKSVAENMYNWLGDFTVLRTLVQRVVAQRLGREYSAVELILREAFGALKRAHDRFVEDEDLPESEYQDEAAERRERLEEEAATAVLRWLGTVSEIPKVFNALSESERASVRATASELVSVLFKDGERIPDVPWVGSKRVRIAEEEISKADEEYEAVDGSEDQPAPPKRARKTRGGAKGVVVGAEAAQKVCRSRFEVVTD